MTVQTKPIMSAHALRIKQAEVERKFFNKMQRHPRSIGAHAEYLIASRGTGKSEGIDARFIIRNVWEMPGSLGALISPSYSKAWCNTLPAICKALAEWGYIQNIHYVVGHKAHSSMGFADPVRPIVGNEGWGNAFHFSIGTVMVLPSFHPSMSANSLSLVWVLGPVAKFLFFVLIMLEFYPANPCNFKCFCHCPHHHSVCYSTDMPTTGMGKWILEKRAAMSPRHINLIRSMYKDLQAYKRKPMTDHTLRMIRELQSDLDLARKFQPPVIPEKGKKREHTAYYGEYDIFDNIEVVGEDYI